MSLTIILISKQSIWAIADKRVSRRDFSFVHDERQKIRKIKDDLYLSGFGECAIGDLWHKALVENNHLTVSQLIELAGKLPRKLPFPTNKQLLYDKGFIYGNEENGKLFLWIGHPDGTTEIIKPDSGIICKCSGMNHDNLPVSTVNKVLSHLYDLLCSGKDIRDSLISSLKYGASIDKVVSPTYDFIQLNNKSILK